MEIIVVATVIALVLVSLRSRALPDTDRAHRSKRLTVAGIQAGLAAESARNYVPVYRAG
ncbi:hypothetical protein ACWDOP_07895 [Nocardia sp. NPDC003693]